MYNIFLFQGSSLIYFNTDIPSSIYNSNVKFMLNACYTSTFGNEPLCRALISLIHIQSCLVITSFRNS